MGGWGQHRHSSRDTRSRDAWTPVNQIFFGIANIFIINTHILPVSWCSHVPPAQTTRARPLLSDERRLLTSPAPRVEMAPRATALFLAGKEIDWYIYDMLLAVSQRFVFPLRSSLVPKWKLFRPAPILSRLSLQLYGLLFRRVSLVSVASLSLHRRETGPRRSSRWFRHGGDEIYLYS